MNRHEVASRHSVRYKSPVSKKRPSTITPTTKHDPAYWRERLFRNVFTYKGRKREVRAWSVKIQFCGQRRIFRLKAPDPAQAAGEACQIYRTITEQGWAAVAPGAGPSLRPRGVAQPASALLAITQDQDYWRRRLIQRKYPESGDPTAPRQFSVRIEHARSSHYFPLGTSDETAAAVRALEIHRTVVQQGWGSACNTFARELSIALRWQDNPLAWTYFTIHTHTSSYRLPPPPATDHASGHQVVFIEPDATIRRALADYANCQSGFRCEMTLASSAEAVREIPRRRVDLAFVNHDLPEETDAMWLEELSRLRPELVVLSYSVFEDPDQLFKSTPGGSMLYMLRRTAPSRLLEPLEGLTETPTRERIASQVSKYFQHWVGQLPSGPPAWKLARLTPREHQILDFLSQGDLVKEIAVKLGLSNWTVQGHVKNIFEKLKVHTRTEAVVKYLQK